jgi:D-threonate/D-erythronate kinase
MDRRWLIIADDLTGAADSAIAFAKRRLPAHVGWGEPRAGEWVDECAFAFDADTRRLDPASAARRHQDILRRLLDPRAQVFKKIDSTLRGHPAEEIGAMLDVLAASTSRVRAVFTPAFPAGGRITRGGRVFVHGTPLEHTEFWVPARPVEHADIATLFESAGLHAHRVALETVRGDPARLRAALEPGRGGADVCVCDAETEQDLDRIVEAGLEDPATFFAGSAGLAHSIASHASRAAGRRTGPVAQATSNRGALLLVGSQASPSRAALARLASLPGIHHVSVSADGADFGATLPALERAIEDGVDVVIDIAPPINGPLVASPQIVDALARRIAPLAARTSGLMATGGDSAAALLTHCGVRGIRLIDELEPGISLGITLGALTLPVITKSGGFGDEGSLQRIAERLRFIRQTGTVA